MSTLLLGGLDESPNRLVPFLSTDHLAPFLRFQYIYNEGCPIDSTNLEKIDFYENKKILTHIILWKKTEQIKKKQVDHEMPDGTQITINPISIEIITVINNDKNDKEGKKDKNKDERDKKTDRTLNSGSSRGLIEVLNVYFDSEDATLINSYNDQIIEFVNRYDFSDGSAYQIIIVGHTDNGRDENYNLILSKKRAETVRRKLETIRAKIGQIQVYYCGEWKPLKNKENEEQKGFNRRIEIKALKK